MTTRKKLMGAIADQEVNAVMSLMKPFLPRIGVCVIACRAMVPMASAQNDSPEKSHSQDTSRISDMNDQHENVNREFTY